MRTSEAIAHFAEFCSKVFQTRKQRQARGEPIDDLPVLPEWVEELEADQEQQEAEFERSQEAERLRREIAARSPKPQETTETVEPAEETGQKRRRRRLVAVPDPEPEPEPEPQPTQAADVFLDDEPPPTIPSGWLEFEDGSSRPVDDDDRRRGVGWRP